MDVDAATVIAVLGLIIAALSWWESRRAAAASKRSAGAAERSATASHDSAQAAQEATRLERERRHEELEPEIHVEWRHELVGARGNSWASGVRIRSEGPLDYSRVIAKLLPPHSGAHQAAARIHSLSSSHTGGVGDEIPLGELPRGGQSRILVYPTRDENGDPRGGEFRLWLLFGADNDAEWVLVRTSEIPRPGSVDVPRG